VQSGGLRTGGVQNARRRQNNIKQTKRLLSEDAGRSLFYALFVANTQRNVPKPDVTGVNRNLAYSLRCSGLSVFSKI
jgi:hypothetical protein